MGGSADARISDASPISPTYTHIMMSSCHWRAAIASASLAYKPQSIPFRLRCWTGVCMRVCVRVCVCRCACQEAVL